VTVVHSGMILQLKVQMRLMLLLKAVLKLVLMDQCSAHHHGAVIVLRLKTALQLALLVFSLVLPLNSRDDSAEHDIKLS
jgi:hypothetical protein